MVGRYILTFYTPAICAHPAFKPAPPPAPPTTHTHPTRTHARTHAHVPSLSLTHISSLHTAHRACTRAHAASTGPIGRLQPDWFESAHCIARHRAKPMARPRPRVLYVVVRCVLYVIACCCVLYIVCCRLWSLAIPTARREAAMHGRFRPQLCLHVVRRMLLPWCAAYAPAVDRLALARCARV